MSIKAQVTETPPQIGIIADSSLHRHILKTAISHHGYSVAVNVAPERFEIEQLQKIDAWLVDVADVDQWESLIDQLLDHTSAPVLFGEGDIPSSGQPEYPVWERRLFSKLIDVVGRFTPAEPVETLQDLPEPKFEGAVTIPLPSECKDISENFGATVERVWVLGASLGGPAAVKLFLDCLPKGLPVAFVYAQHINEHFQGVLTQVLGRHSHFKLSLGSEGEPLNHGAVHVAPVEHEIGFSLDGKIEAKNRPWEGPYTPSIDQVVRNAARSFGPVSGAIIFSGMGNDGAIACPEMVERGGTVWAQTPDTCDASSMPESVIATGSTSFVGTPQQLAAQLVEHVRQSIRNEKSA